ncbi:hypothetical protein HMPREF1983_01305 [Gemella bergeri ATCC 700627]|uniref:DUF2974 domain-containing protein n=1 Tax=Gemella bergeri ATCC 700627 TaxID=1321820 RepID=U2S1X0_9BACL|nr:DUF2974 domain-containing protein [Gemella bergeri]ERK56812.1 hypothetical protein HMPREF1983_01305 [Gemella bergeri ATCC 700627]
MAKELEVTSYASFIVYRIEAMDRINTPKRVIKEFIELQKIVGKFPKELEYLHSFYDKNTGSSGALFKNIDKDNYVLSFTGTNFYFDREKDLYADIVGICLGQGEHYSVCYKFYKKMEKKYGKNIILTGHSLGGNIAQRVALEYNVAETIVYNAAPLYLIGGIDIFMNKDADNELYQGRLSRYKRVVNRIEKKKRLFTGDVKRIVSEQDVFTRIAELLNIGYYIGEEYIIKEAGMHGIKNFLGERQLTLKELLVEDIKEENLSTEYKEFSLAEINMLKYFSEDKLSYLENQLTGMLMSETVMSNLNKNPYHVDFRFFLTNVLEKITETKNINE